MKRMWAVANINPTDWDAELLGALTSAELAGICTLMGIPKSGTKERQIARLLDAAELRTILAQFAQPEELAGFFKLAELRAFATRAGTYRWLNKRGVAAGLLTWRNDCRRRGKDALEDYQRWRAEQPARARQLRMEV